MLKIIIIFMSALILLTGSGYLTLSAKPNYLDKSVAPYSKYTFKISSLCGKSATGFKLNQAHGIFTALHAVTNGGQVCKEIRARFFKYDKIKKQNTARQIIKLKLDKLIIGKDIAFLSFTNDNTLSESEIESYKGKGITVSKKSPKQIKQGIIVPGYPVNMHYLLTSNYTLRPNSQIAPLNTLLSSKYTSTKERKLFRNRNSPSIDMEVLNIQGHLKTGHSGAPILDSENELIGMINGGIMDKDISWGIPWKDIGSSLKKFNESLPNNLKYSTRSHYSNTKDNKNLILKISLGERIESIELPDHSVEHLLTIPPSNQKQFYIYHANDYKNNLIAKGGINSLVRSKDGKYEFKISSRGGKLTFLFNSPPSYIKQDDYIINKKENLTWTNDIVFMSWNDALKYSENAGFMGNNNWRLPTKNELLTIAKYAHSNPSFFNSDNNWFWSKESADRFSTTRKAWLVNGGNATDYKYKEEKEYRKESVKGEYAIRLVRFNN